MIVTVTANPSLDRTVVLDAPLQPGQVQAAASSREDAGGKGINVARVLDAAGVPARAIVPLAADDPYRAALAAHHLDVRPLAVAGHCRSNVAITDAAGVTTKLNLPGASPTPAELDALSAAIVDAAAGTRWLVLAGSLPPGVPDGFYASVIRAVRARWGEAAPRIAVDASGPALREAVGARPDLIKPNDDELEDLTGIAVDRAADPAGAAARIARALVPSLVGAVLVTLGSAGAVFVDAAGAYAARPPRIRVRSTVGAGDSALAGYLLAEAAGAGPAACLVSAVRHGAAAASLPGTGVPAPHDLPADDIAVARVAD